MGSPALRRLGILAPLSDLPILLDMRRRPGLLRADPPFGKRQCRMADPGQRGDGMKRDQPEGVLAGKQTCNGGKRLDGWSRGITPTTVSNTLPR